MICSLPLSDELVLLLQNLGTLFGKVRGDCSAELDVSSHFIELERRQEGIILESVHVHDMLSNIVVLIIILVIEDQEEDVETGHNGWGYVHIVPQTSGPVISAMVWIGGSED